MSDIDPVTGDPSSAPAPAGVDPGLLRFLRILVTALTGTMIVGVIAVVYLLVTRLPGALDRPTLPAAITLPDGAKAEAVTMGRGWVAVVTDQGEIVVLDAVTGAVRQRVKVGE